MAEEQGSSSRQCCCGKGRQVPLNSTVCQPRGPALGQVPNMWRLINPHGICGGCNCPHFTNGHTEAVRSWLPTRGHIPAKRQMYLPGTMQIAKVLPCPLGACPLGTVLEACFSAFRGSMHSCWKLNVCVPLNSYIET